VLAVELRPKKTRRALQNIAGALQFSVLLFELADPLRLGGRNPRGVAVVDVGLAHPRAHRLDALPELVGDPLHRPMIGAHVLHNVFRAPIVYIVSATVEIRGRAIDYSSR
jgi:hypothetical protein